MTGIGEGFINIRADEIEEGLDKGEFEPLSALLLSLGVLGEEIENVF